jgi:hypothetical protein
MEQNKQLALKKLLAKSARECGLDDIDHKKLSRLLAEADAEPYQDHTPGKAIFTAGNKEFNSQSDHLPCSPLKTEVKQ